MKKPLRKFVRIFRYVVRYPLTEEEPWYTKGIHKMPFKNFLVYYLIDEDKKAVWITAVIYGRRDQITALADMSLSDTE